MQPFPGRGVFFLVRHGETDWNRERRIMGRLPVSLNETGREQLRALAPYLEGVGIASIWTSPLPRARVSAEILAEALGGHIEVREDAGLTEVDFGAWEGRTFAEVLADPAFAAFQREPLATTFPGGENLLAVRARVFAAMQRVAACSDGERTAVVSHGDPLRLVIAGCLGLDGPEFRRLRIDNAAVSAVELTGDWAEVKFLNMRPDLASLVAVSAPASRGGAGKRRASAGSRRTAGDAGVGG